MKKYIKRLSLILALAMIFVIAVGCSKEEAPEVADEDGSAEEVEDQSGDLYPLEIVDGFGEQWTFEEEPERIVSLSPNDTEILFALELGEKVVGVSNFSDYPEEALEKEKIGDAEGINLEKIIELEPDLVINYGPSDTEELERLKEAGIKVLGYQPETIDEIMDTIKNIGEITNTRDKASDITSDIGDKRDEISDKLEGVEKKRVFYEIWHDPLMAAGPGSFMDELIKYSGGINIAADAEGGYANYDLESLVEKDPEVYLTASDLPEKTIESISKRPGYEEITAIKQGKIYLLDGNIVSRPGPRIIQALELVAKAIHPEIFE